MKRKMLFLFFGYFFIFSTPLQAYSLTDFGNWGKSVPVLDNFLPTGLMFHSFRKYPKQTFVLMAGLALYGFYRSDTGKKLLISWGIMKAAEEKKAVSQSKETQAFDDEDEDEMDENIFVFEGSDSFVSKRDEIKKVIEAHKENNATVPVYENKEEVIEKKIEEILTTQENELLLNNDSVVDNEDIEQKPLKFL